MARYGFLQRKVRLHALVLAGLLGLILSPTLQAQTPAPASTQNATTSPAQGRSYQGRQNPKLSKIGPINADPNVYVYSAEFARRFQMPEAWISNELQGVDAVAWRLVPDYKWCGWGGDPKACTERMSCEMDLYFDKERNPLPWDANRPQRHASYYNSSVYFLANFPNIAAMNHPNYPVSLRRLRTPVRAGENYSANDSPFVDPKTGKGLYWIGEYWNNKQDHAGIYMTVASFDAEIFTGMALITMSGGCGQAADTLWLKDGLRAGPEKDTAYKQVRLPQAWRVRVQQAQQENKEREAAFFKKEGEKAMRALRAAPAQ